MVRGAFSFVSSRTASVAIVEYGIRADNGGSHLQADAVVIWCPKCLFGIISSVDIEIRERCVEY